MIIQFFKKFLTDMLTGIDGETYDIGRVLLLVSCFIGFGLQIYCTLTGHVFDLQSYGLGVGSLLLGGSGALFIKHNTEPGTTSNTSNQGDNTNDNATK